MYMLIFNRDNPSRKKGGAEVIKSRCKQIPAWYDQVHRQLARDGNRILALASKKLDFNTRAELILATRDQIEDKLEFNGFLITGSPLKEDAIDVVTALQDSSHYVTMITGDALLTALHVARVTKIAKNEIWLLEKKDEGYEWHHGDNDNQFWGRF